MVIRIPMALSALLLLGSCSEQALPVVPEYDASEVQAQIKSIGRPVLLNLWATWCSPCVAELGDLEAVGQELRRDGGELIGLCVEYTSGSADPQKTRSKLPRFIARRGLSFPVWLYTGYKDAEVFEGLPLPRPRRGGIPLTLAIDKDGKVVDFHEGRATREQMRELAKKAAGGH